MTSDYIAIDWGSTNLRAWWYQAGECYAHRSSANGITQLQGETPAAVFAKVTDGWPAQDIPVIMAGMVGSNVGWKIAPYLPCPIGFSEIAGHLTSVAEGFWIVPGLSVRHAENTNVLRGEETQLIGARQLCPAPLYIMPGTHCKWVQADNQQIHDFRTLMTGELHHLLLSSSLIGAGLPRQHENDLAYQRGLERGMSTTVPLAALFEIRAAHLLGVLAQDEVSDYLSGLLIGHEIASMVQYWQPDPTHTITIVGNHLLADRYQRALTSLGYSAQQLDGDHAFQTGIRSIADAMAH